MFCLVYSLNFWEKPMVLELINVFANPYKAITNHLDAAKYAIQNPIDRGLDIHIEALLEQQRKQANWVLADKIKISKALHTYQHKYAKSDKTQVDAEIKLLRLTLTSGQIVYHGGVLNVDQSQKIVVLKHPLSTTFNPKVAVSEAIHKGKAYLSKALHLNVIKVQNPNVNVYPFKQGLRMSLEEEILFEAGINLKRGRDAIVDSNYKVFGNDSDSQNVEAHVIEWTIV